LLASGIILAGAIPIAKLQLGSWEGTGKRKIRLFNPFLVRFLPPFMIWNIVLGSFAPFAPVYLQRHLGSSLQHIGIIFSLSQLAQFSAVLLAPLLYRKSGRVAGVAFAQLCTGIALVCVAAAGNAGIAIGCYLGFSALQWMSGPGIYSLLMENVPDEERSTASAFQNISGALCQAATAAVTGYCIVRFGYATVLYGNAGAAGIAAILFFGFLHRSRLTETTEAV
jgi:MFS family permease